MAKSNKNLFSAPVKTPLSQKTSIAAPMKSSTVRDTSARALSVSTLTRTSPINFGSFRVKTTTATGGSAWSSLLQNAASGGIASAVGGSFSAITGLGGLVSGLLGLFQGTKTTPVPAQFTIPETQQSTMALHGQPAIGSTRAPSVPVTSSAGGGGNSGTQTISVAYKPSAPVADHSQVVQVVRQAILTSSSLNDVIAEI